MTRFTTLIAEDEPLAREGLADWVRQSPQLELAAVCADGASALRALRELRPALLLIDIQMPELNGLEVVRRLADDDAAELPRVIFTTAFDQHAVEAFELHAADYLLKPFSRERFDEAVQHALQADAARERAVPTLDAAAPTAGEPLTRVFVRDQGKIFPLLVQDIEYLRSDNKYTALVSKGHSYLVRLPIAAFLDRLDPGRFMKVNRSCLVNLDFVVAMTPNEGSQFEVQLRDGTRVTASRDVSKLLRTHSL
jgi:two-component system LytT family response regulator